MIELPEAITLAKQINDALLGRTIVSAEANHSPHGFAWYTGDPALYGDRLSGLTIDGARSQGGIVEILAGPMSLLFNDGASPRLYDEPPAKHQLLLALDDGRYVAATVRMYGGMLAYPTGTEDSSYYQVAVEKPSPLGEGFTEEWFEGLRTAASPKTTAKALLATEQRIPGLGNGVLHDILFAARIHPKQAVGRLTGDEYARLYHAVRDVLAEMTRMGGRETERDLFGNAGGFHPLAKTPLCPVCGEPIRKEAYMGGAVYYCPVCQPLRK